jgi:hypothetical protein
MVGEQGLCCPWNIMFLENTITVLLLGESVKKMLILFKEDGVP